MLQVYQMKAVYIPDPIKTHPHDPLWRTMTLCVTKPSSSRSQSALQRLIVHLCAACGKLALLSSFNRWWGWDAPQAHGQLAATPGGMHALLTLPAPSARLYFVWNLSSVCHRASLLRSLAQSFVFPPLLFPLVRAPKHGKYCRAGIKEQACKEISCFAY